MLPARLTSQNALFLDFDGTLAEVPVTPDAVNLPPGLPAMLHRLYDRLGGAVALITGRDISDLRKYLPDFPGAISGSHGAELSLDGRTISTTDDTQLDIPALHAAAHQFARGYPPILVEEKRHGVVLHYRADPSLAEVVHAAMRQLQRDFPGTGLQAAKMQVELRPAGVGKDKALDRLMELSPYRGRIPVYAGDDLPDEVAMAEAQARGGIAIKVGDGETVAHYRVANPAALAAWLDP
ncbi:trehalose-phosphatase [Paracoccus sp. 11-3]|uniref:Trehalose 6-phosphate phosphatase n=1 Tax=Paracoccus amoyensis TaxID=2760093 RepID=A0A926JE15_9RHOB|nr:trehalose-phosphatase [Paracoccus amoyensis]MBC9247673.1 trehalose-phosphatase [Paracoccus amoyensis]